MHGLGTRERASRRKAPDSWYLIVRLRVLLEELDLGSWIQNCFEISLDSPVSKCDPGLQRSEPVFQYHGWLDLTNELAKS